MWSRIKSGHEQVFPQVSIILIVMMIMMMIIIKIVVIFHDFDYFITEMFLGHVASLHALGVDGFSAQFEQVPDLDDDDDHGDDDLDDHGDDLHVMGLSICLDIFEKGPTKAINIIMIFMLPIIMPITGIAGKRRRVTKPDSWPSNQPGEESLQ